MSKAYYLSRMTKGGDNMPELKFPVLILGYRPYSFVNDNGEKLEGVSVHYIGTEKAKKGTFVGHNPQKTSLKMEALNDLKDLNYPIYADCFYEIDPSSRTNPMQIVGFKRTKDLAV